MNDNNLQTCWIKQQNPAAYCCNLAMYRLCDECYSYLIGSIEPTYPVPATIKEVEILPDRVILWERIGTHITPGFQHLFAHYLAWQH